MDDHRALDGEAGRGLDGGRGCLAGIDQRWDGDAADGMRTYTSSPSLCENEGFSLSREKVCHESALHPVSKPRF